MEFVQAQHKTQESMFSCSDKSFNYDMVRLWKSLEISHNEEWSNENGLDKEMWDMQTHIPTKITCLICDVKWMKVYNLTKIIASTIYDVYYIHIVSYIWKLGNFQSFHKT